MTFTERVEATAADLALLYAGEPDDKVERSLAQLRVNLEVQLSKIFAGADMAAAVDLFIDAVLTSRRQIEAGATSMSGGSKPS